MGSEGISRYVQHTYLEVRGVTGKGGHQFFLCVEDRKDERSMPGRAETETTAAATRKISDSFIALYAET